MRLVYNILFPVFFLLSAPYYFWKLWRRGDWRSGFSQRLGCHSAALKQALAGKRVLWLHAVSVGEANLCAQLVEALRPQLPGWELVASATTTTGMAELRKRLPADVHTIYFPVDLLPCVRATWRALNPSAVVLVEAEIWPNFFWQAQSRGVPVALVNARLSDRSWRGYQRFGALFGKIFQSLRCVGAQNESDAEKLRALGCRPEAITVTGNLKFDGAIVPLQQALDVTPLLRRLGVREGAPVLVAGSTHEGEEEMLASITVRLRRTRPDLFLVVVPRHFERARAIEERLRAMGVRVLLRSAAENAHPPQERIECLLVDSTGELRLFYEAATVVFVGKSLCAQGGQNPIEPAALGKPVVFGPHMQNFRAVVQAFENANAVVKVADEAALESALAALLDDRARCADLGERALAVVRRNQGATQRTAAMVVRMLEAKG